MEASAAIVRAAAKGELAPSAAESLSRLVEAHVRIAEVKELEDRLDGLETRLESQEERG